MAPFLFFDELADEDVGAVLGDGELADAVGGAVHRAGIGLPAGRLGDDVGFAGLQVAVIDRDIAFVRRPGSKREVEPKTKWFAVGGEGLGDVAGGFGGGAGIDRSRPCPGSVRRWAGGAARRWSRRRSRASRFRGRRRRRCRGRRRLQQGRGEGSGRGGGVGGDADIFGGPAVVAAGGEVGIDAAVGGVAGAGDAAVVDAVEERGLPASG